jgi:hypothetical protein
MMGNALRTHIETRKIRPRAPWYATATTTGVLEPAAGVVIM